MEKQPVLIKSEDGTTLELYPKDLEILLRWDEAVKIAESLGDGWRLPTKKEFDVIYNDIFKIDNNSFKTTEAYWTMDEVDGRENWAWTFYFDTGRPWDDTKEFKTLVRLIRTCKQEAN